MSFAEVARRLCDRLIYLESDQDLLLTGARLVDGTGARPREKQTVLIRGERIAYVGRDGEVPPTRASTRTYECAGKTVIPGLIDCHVHFTGQSASNAFERYAPSVREPYRTISAAIDAMRVLDAGFTTVRDLGHGPAEQAFAIREAVADGIIPGPRVLASGWAISQTGGHGDPRIFPEEITRRYRPRSTFADGPDECRRAVRQNFGEGADCIKIYATEGSLVAATVAKEVHPNFTVEEITAMTDEAHRRRAKVAAHATSVEGVRNAVLGGVDTIEHGGPLGQAPELLEEMARRGVYLVPTLKVYDSIATDGGRWGVQPQGVRIAAHLRSEAMSYLRRARDVGVRVAVGTDMSWFDRGDNAQELVLLVEAGFTPLEAIEAATRTAAGALGLEEHIGTIEVGKLGELLVIETDPLADISSLRDPQNIRLIFKSRGPISR